MSILMLKIIKAFLSDDIFNIWVNLATKGPIKKLAVEIRSTAGKKHTLVCMQWR